MVAGMTEEAALLAVEEASEHSRLPVSSAELEQVRQMRKNDVGVIPVHEILLWSVHLFHSLQRAALEGFKKPLLAF